MAVFRFLFAFKASPKYPPGGNGKAFPTFTFFLFGPCASDVTGTMPVHLMTENDVLAVALPGNDDDAASETSHHTARLYEGVSDDDFSDAHSDFVDGIARLEREYFDQLHVNDVPENAGYGNFAGGATGVRNVSSFEREHFHSTNVTQDLTLVSRPLPTPLTTRSSPL